MHVLRYALIAIMVGSAFASPALAQGPVPPARLPPEFQQPVEGYDLGILYQRWRYWVEGQKGRVVEQLLEKLDQVEGRRPVGSPLLRFTMYNDFGAFLSGDIRVYCPVSDSHAFDSKDCDYLFRSAIVDADAAGYGDGNPISEWTRQSFDAVTLARHLRASGLPPETDWWSADSAVMFATLPSAESVLRENATIKRMTSRDCPAMGHAIEAMERERIDLPVDLFGVGADQSLNVPHPHSIRATYKLNLLADGGALMLDGGSPALQAIVLPTLKAVDACESAVKPSIGSTSSDIPASLPVGTN